MGAVTLLGPQRHPAVAPELERLGLEGPVAVVTAGWQEREDEIDEMREHLDREVRNLRLYARADEVAAEDRELFRGHRARQDRLRALQTLYRYRLDFALEPARELLSQRGPTDLAKAARRSAIEALRELDRQHVVQIQEIHQEFHDRYEPFHRPVVERHCQEIRELLEGCCALLIAGGHVAVLLNRMRHFGLSRWIGDLPVVAWSAGAMAVSNQVVLFHDHPPQGMGNPEVLDVGLGLVDGIVVLPHADKRLRLNDPKRVEILARRFAPAACVPFDRGAPALTWDGKAWHHLPGTRQLTVTGHVRVEAA